jgi:sensor c-di-GMP phosphodiesterase-like protein
VEGVEDADTLAALREWGCDVAQGYHIARPMTADSFLPWLVQRPSQLTPAIPAPRDGPRPTQRAAQRTS